MPDAFVPLAEHTGLIKQLSIWALRTALQQIRAWCERDQHIRVAVNLSARGLHDPQLAATMSRLVRTSDVTPAWLGVEITESAVMADPERSLQTLSRLHEMGIRISIDDFGTGYSSLAYLQRFPVDEIKIDRSFIIGMGSNPDNIHIVRSIIDLGHNLNLRVIAEGVEDRETCEVMAGLGCDVAQGYYFSRPVSSDRLIPWLQERMESSTLT